MRIKIDKKGYLWLEREGKLKYVYCPYLYPRNEKGTEFCFECCGDWCALFSDKKDYENAVITLCRKEYVCEIQNFIDERINDK